MYRYVTEMFCKYDNEEPEEVTLLCHNEVMNGVIDQFGLEITVKKLIKTILGQK